MIKAKNVMITYYLYLLTDRTLNQQILFIYVLK
jgi:hypothetical protein